MLLLLLLLLVGVLSAPSCPSILSFFIPAMRIPAVSNNTKLQVNHKDQGPSPPHFSLLLRVTADRTECAIAMN